MRKPVSIACLLLAWLCANGAVLDAVQVFAWARMFTGYTQTMTPAAALRATLDPAKPCELCVSIAQTKSDLAPPQAAPAPEPAPKLVLALQALPPLVFAHGPGDWPASPPSTGPSWHEPVPVPPPRA